MKMRNGLIALALVLSTPVYAADNAVTLSGTIKVEASMAEDDAGVKTSDVVVDTAAVAIDAQINNGVSAHVAFLYEEDAAVIDGSTFALDEATIALKMGSSGALIAGRMYVPFGSFETKMVSDPLTRELGKTSETAIMLSMVDGNVTGSIYTFNGDADETSALLDNDELSYGVNITYAAGNMILGTSYISNIADTDSLQNPGGLLSAAVPGMGVNLIMAMNNVILIAEHVAATESFTTGDELAAGTVGNGLVSNNETPTATNIELAFDSGNSTVAFAYQTTEEAQFLGLPETVSSVAFSFDVMKDTSIGIEYKVAEDYDGNEDSAYTLQLAVKF